MSLNKVNYVDGVTVITAQNMNDIQDAIVALESEGGSGVTSVNGKKGVVVLTASDIGAGTYSKPSGGIPKTDLASAVQTSLGKADTALQSVPSSYRTAAAQDLIDSEKIDKPSNPAVNDFLCWNGTTWVAKTVPNANGVSF